MRLRISLFIAARYFSGKSGSNLERRRLFGAVAGIALSLVPLVLVLHVADGMIEGITRRYVEVGSYHIQIRNFLDPDEAETEELIDRIEEIEGIRLVFPVYQGTSLAAAPAGQAGGVVRGLPPDLYDRDEGLNRFLEFTSGSYDLADRDSVLLSGQIAEDLGVGVGDRIKLLTAKSFPGRPVILRPTALTVTGIFTTGYRELDAFTLYVNTEQGRRLFQDRGALFFGVKTDNPYGSLQGVLSQIRNVLPGGWYAYMWYELERSMYKSLQTTRQLLYFIMALIVIVAAVNISSALVMLVLERSREIAIEKCLGLNGASVRGVFLITGLIIGVMGTAAGLLFGVFLSVNINGIIAGAERFINWLIGIGAEGGRVVLLNPDYYLEEIPIRVKLIPLLVTGMFTLVVSVLAAYIPARKAGRTRPVEVFRRH
jgi:lipoprotein-releasing system permease protein